MSETIERDRRALAFAAKTLRDMAVERLSDPIEDELRALRRLLHGTADRLEDIAGRLPPSAP